MTELCSGMRLELLSMRHRPALEDFERDSRAFFAQQVGDRGDDFFDRFGERLAERVAENDCGKSMFFVVVDANGAVLARINISDVDDPDLTELGYRVAESAQGRRIATCGVGAALLEAAAHGVRTVRAKVSIANPASQHVLDNCGFDCDGPIDAPEGAAAKFLGYRKNL